MQCPQCHHDVQPGNRVCGNCGTVLAQSAVSATVIQAPPRRRRRWIPIVGGALGVIVLLVIAAGIAGLLPFGRPPGVATIYRITGTAASVEVTWESQRGITDQIREQTLPWELKRYSEVGTYLYVSAGNKGETGTVKCEIVRGGTVIMESSADTAYGIATCTLLVP